MKGTAGSMGFADLSTAAAALDTSLKRLKEANGPVASGHMEDALQLLSGLQEMLSRTTPEMSTLYNADLSRLTK